MFRTGNSQSATLAILGLPVLALALFAWGSPRSACAQAIAPANGAGSRPTAASNAQATKPTFAGNDQEGFHFQTEEIQGTIQLNGSYHGLTRLVDRRSGRQVVDPRYSALNLFKLMSVNLVMGQPRKMDRLTRVSPHWVEVKWPSTETHRAEVTARYEVRPPNAVDLSVTVRSQGAYADYELFLSSYFDKALRPHAYLKSPDRSAADLVLPTVNDVFRGTVLVFPRDSHAARRCLDGRWDRNEAGTPVVPMCPVRPYAHCLALLADPEKQLGVLLMSHPAHCYAISTRYHADNDADRLTTYSAFDFSLFGEDLLPGDERTVKVRLAVTPLDRQFSQPWRLYREFLAEMNPNRDPWPK